MAETHLQRSTTDAAQAFAQAYPEYAETQVLDDLRASDYSRLDETGSVYLDYTGGGLYAVSQIEEHTALLKSGVFGNPHSSNPSSLASTELVDAARSYILEYFNASPDEYVAIFTANATAAIKLVGEAYPFGPGDQYLLTFDNHNSINGIREFASNKGADVTYAPVHPPELRVDRKNISTMLAKGRKGGNNLFAFPAQSNFSGVKHSLEMVAEAQALGWDVLLDSAAFVPTNWLDLSVIKPDFVPLSFYKMFGYPTGVGCLLARRSALAKLQRPWFAGGTIAMASVQANAYTPEEGVAEFEEGTVNYLGLTSIEIGLRHIASIGVETIGTRVRCLTGWLLQELFAMRHSSGGPLVQIYGPTDMSERGGTVTTNFYGPDGEMIDHLKIEELANQAGISVRTGCFCNPGAGEVAHGLSKEEMDEAFKDGARMTRDQFMSALNSRDGKSAGAVRISLGMVSNLADVEKFLAFCRTFLDRPAGEV
jgi:molybdenum cofactor sulfurtransferase